MTKALEERIALHLYKHRTYVERPVVPQSLVVEVIAREVGASRRTVDRKLHALLEEGAVDRRVAHVEGLDRRRFVFVITPKGVAELADEDRRSYSDNIKSPMRVMSEPRTVPVMNVNVALSTRSAAASHHVETMTTKTSATTASDKQALRL